MLRVLFILMFFTACVPMGNLSNSSNENNLLQDAAFVTNIKTILLYPQTNAPQSVLLPPAAPLTTQNLILAFDDLAEQFNHYTIKITHCNADWTKSGLANLDFLYEYNSFPIQTYSFSADTHIPYIHYSVKIPKVKLAGNYVVTVYRDDEYPVLSKRFYIYQQMIQVAERRDVSAAQQLGNKQPISIKLNYQSLPIINSNDQFVVTLRQNQRWDNIIYNLTPTIIREQEKSIEYLVTDEKEMHSGGNEYRFIDLRTIINTGQNISKIDRSTKPYVAHSGLDINRNTDRYSQYLDFNGNFVIQNFDSPLTFSENYVKTRLYLKASLPNNARVYVIGAFNQDIATKDKTMRYDSLNGVYTQEFLLKQGWYNYQYKALDGNGKSINLEGEHFETENEYEVMVYYRSMQPQADILAGYLRINRNKR